MDNFLLVGRIGGKTHTLERGVTKHFNGTPCLIEARGFLNGCMVDFFVEFYEWLGASKPLDINGSHLRLFVLDGRNR